MAKYHESPDGQVRACSATSPDKCKYGTGTIHGDSVEEVYAEIERKSAELLHEDTQVFHNTVEEREDLAQDVLADLNMNGHNSEIYTYNSNGDLIITFEDDSHPGSTLNVVIHKSDLDEVATREEAVAVIELAYVERFKYPTDVEEYAEEQVELMGDSESVFSRVAESISATNNFIESMNKVREKYNLAPMDKISLDDF